MVDARAWNKLNLWRRPTGELAVRPGLRRIQTPDAGRIFVAGFSIQNPYTLEVWHYTLDLKSDGTQLRIRIADEQFTTFQTFSFGIDVDPRGVSHAVVEGMIAVCSPDFPTLFGLVGTGLVRAIKVTSDNPATTAIDVPQGICSAWCNRIVIASGPSLFVSDPVAVTGGDIRTFVAENQNNRPAPVFGIHEGAGGQLVVLTGAGVYGLDASAAAVGIVGSNGTDWRMLNHHQCYSFDSSCNVRGRIYALTKRGYMLVDIENNVEELLDDPMQARAYGPRIASVDYRTSRMIGADDGPLVALGDACSVHDLAQQLRSWWTQPIAATFRVRGILRDVDGNPLLLCEDGVYIVDGNFDGNQALGAGTTSQPNGILHGEVPGAPSDNRTVREVQVSAALGGVGSIVAAVRGDPQTATPVADARAYVIGTNTWADTGLIAEPAPMASRRLQFNLNSDDVGIEVGAQYANTRLLGLIDVDYSASAPKRPTDRGPA